MADDDLDSFFADIEGEVKKAAVPSAPKVISVSSSKPVLGKEALSKTTANSNTSLSFIPNSMTTPSSSYTAPVNRYKGTIPFEGVVTEAHISQQASAYDYDPSSYNIAKEKEKEKESKWEGKEEEEDAVGKKRKHERYSAGRVWTDDTLDDWPEGDYRLFVGDLGIEATDEMLTAQFMKYKTFNKAKVIRDKRTKKTKGYGFVSFQDPFDCLKALREMHGKYCGNRPMRLKKSEWDKKEKGEAKKRMKGLEGVIKKTIGKSFW